MKLLIKYATRGRAQKFLDVMKNIETTIKRQDYKIIVSIDRDDKEMVDLTAKRGFKNTEVWINEPDSKIGAINANMPLSGWDWLVNMSDDMRFTVRNWDEIMESRIKSVWGDSLDFFAHFNDGFVKEKLPTMSIMGREYYERFFYIYPPCYKSVSCDAEAMYVAMMLGRHHYFPEVLFKHEHPANLRTKADKTYQMNSKYEQGDTAVYFERLNKNFYVNNPGPTPFDEFKTLKGWSNNTDHDNKEKKMHLAV